MTGQSPIKGLGEVAFRVNNLAQMKRFYQDVLGLEVLGEFPTAVLLKIAEGYGGHTQVLGLFDRSVPVGPGEPPLITLRLRSLSTTTNQKRNVWRLWG